MRQEKKRKYLGNQKKRSDIRTTDDATHIRRSVPQRIYILSEDIFSLSCPWDAEKSKYTQGREKPGSSEIILRASLS